MQLEEKIAETLRTKKELERQYAELRLEADRKRAEIKTCDNKLEQLYKEKAGQQVLF